MQTYVVAGAAVGAVLVTAGAMATGGMRHGLVGPIGFVAGVALYHAAFGFTSAWRRLLVDQRSVGIRAQLVMLAVTIAVFFPLLAAGAVLGKPVYGYVFPVGVALGVGAFLFGIGMQLGGGCGSGTLYTAGGGNARMVVTLAAFIAGSVLAAWHFPTWSAWPAIDGVSAVHTLGLAPASVMALALVGLSYAGVRHAERARHGTVQPLIDVAGARGGHALLAGPWPLLAGALVLAAVNVATLAVSGAPWGITSAFALWGTKMLGGLGVDVASWPFWRGNGALEASVLADRTSVMDFTLMLGALAAAGAAGRFAPDPRITAGPLAAAIVGGLAMGYGARLATGCNIGAFFSGIASGSLHGVAWLAFAMAGNAVGVRLRPRFGMA